jgi:diguanylate cyclase (GGDEF)-like protein/PAS domain S-box-containing protein
VVLIADDDELMRSLTAATLDDQGFETIGVANGQEAIAALARVRPNLLLLDVDMPIMDGFTACERIRTMPIGADLPVVIVTGSEDTASIDRAFDAGATDFISKPVNWSLLGHRMRYVLRGAQTRTALADSEARNRAMLEALPDRLVLVTANGVIEAVIENTHSVPRRSAREHALVGQPLEQILPGEPAAQARDLLEKVLVRGVEMTFEYAVTVVGGVSNFEVRVLPHSSTVALLIIRDITARKRTEAQIHRLAFYDPLTDLPNRHYLLSRCGDALSAAKRNGERYALCHLNLDQFKRINDTLGPAAGDSTLRQIAERMGQVCESVRSTETHIELARLGGDEFVIWFALRGTSNVETLVQRLKSELSVPVACDRHRLVVTASIGSAIYPDDGADVAALLTNAGKAMSSAKGAGRNTHRVFARGDHEPASDALELESDLRRAIESNELVLHFQPKFDLRTGALSGAEALVRWRHPTRGMIAPGAFIPIAEATGLIVDIDRWVVEEVCRQLRAWHDIGIDPVSISINLSGREFCFDQPEITLQRSLRRYGISPQLLEVEITETVLMADPASASETLRKLSAMGIRLALDDFGTGYSSLGYLKHFPLNVLKIDRAFVADIESNENDRALCRAVISMARALHLEVVAEGIETEGQRRFLCEEGCHVGQGHFLGRPMDAELFCSRLLTSPRGARPNRSR